MSNAIDVLREQYNIMISQEEDWSFFRALAGYINYILETPILKKIIDGVMEKKQKEYDKLAELEEKALEELETSKDKLLKIIKDNNISPNSLSADFSIIPQGGNVLENLKEFEKNKLWISGFRSDNLERFLFDIASSILKSNHKSLLKNFLVSDEEYRKYHYEPDSKFTITGNENGNFVFSKSLKLRREQSRFIEKTEKFQLWGAFNALLKFQEAFLEKSKNKDFGYISKGHKKGARNWQEGDDTVDIVFFAQDLEEIAGLKNGKPHPNSRHHLKKDSFKNYTSIVNAYLIKELAKDGSREEVRTDVFTEKVKKTEDLLNKLEKDINKRYTR